MSESNSTPKATPEPPVSRPYLTIVAGLGLDAVKLGKVRGLGRAKLKLALNKIGLQTASMLDLRRGMGHLSGQ